MITTTNSRVSQSSSRKPINILWPRNFRFQVTLLMFVLTTVAFGLYAWNTSRQQSVFIVDSIKSTGIALSQNLSVDSANQLMRKDYASIELLLKQYAKLPNVTGVSLIDADGKPMSQVAVIDGRTVVNYDYNIVDRIQLTRHTELINNQRSLSVWEPIIVGKKTIGFIRIYMSLDQAFRERERLFFSTIGFGLLGTIALLLLVFLYFRRPLRAIQEASDFAATLDKHRGETLDVAGFAREFEQLGQSLNLVSQKLLEQEQKVIASSAEAKKLAMVASRTNNAVIITNAKEEIEWVNEGFERITGYSLNEIIGKRPSQFLQGEDTDPEVRKYMRQQLSEQKGFEAELINYSKDGEPYWINIAIQPIFDDTGVLQNFIAIESDVSARKKADVQLYEAKTEAEKANLAKSEFLSRMSHELRTPLNAILGFAQLLELDELNKEQEDSVNRILKAGKHLLALINEVLDISRIESGGMALSIEPVSIKTAVEDVLRLSQPLATEFSITLATHKSLSEEIVVSGDLQRINQVLLNLVSNAIKYNRLNGTVIVSCEPVSCGSQPNKTLRLFVKDTGLGIKEEYFDRLFVPFDRLGAEQSSVEGSGIGLALIKQLLTAMDGDIGVSSIVGEGTTFWVDLPMGENTYLDATATLTALPAEETVFKSCDKSTVVYIEDNVSNLALVEKILSRMGNVNLLTAMQGQEGLELIETQQPDLVLLDLHLPILGGEAVLERLRANEKTHSLPVVVVSADATPNHIERLLDKGANDYLTKPLDVQELIDYVQKYIGAA